MLEVVIDRECPEPSTLSQAFWFHQIWQMNLARTMGSCQGIAELLAKNMNLSEGNWCLASPIFWQATHNDAMVVGLAEQDSSAYFQAFSKFLVQDQSTAFKISHDLWIFDAHFLGETNVSDLNQVMHQSLNSYIQAMPSRWRTWWTEIQMLFQTIDTPSSYVLNGIWPWGGGPWVVSKPIYVYQDTSAFAELELPKWEGKTWPKSGVILVTQDQGLEVYNQLKNASLRVRIWWKDGYEEHQPKSVWQRLKLWVKYAN
jgi:hypothetical protein